MTLSPVFRSEHAVRLLEQQGVWERLGPALARQMDAVTQVHQDFETLIDEQYRMEAGEWFAQRAGTEGAELAFLQDFFFLTLFLDLFENLGVEPARLPFYAELNFTIMGTITAADNLFDDQAKSLLPLRPVAGARFASILQLMCFERLARAAGDRAAEAGLFNIMDFQRAQRGLLDQMAEIGTLEGSEEKGVSEIPTPEAMIERVHRVRGGMLFGLAFRATSVLEQGQAADKLRRAEPAIARLGTAFQIVDDLTDFEFDLTRHSHNLLAAQIRHYGTPAEQARFEALWTGAPPAANGEVETTFAESARAVLEVARLEGRAAFAALHELGYWLQPELADEIVHAIVGLDGLARMTALTQS